MGELHSYSNGQTDAVMQLVVFFGLAIGMCLLKEESCAFLIPSRDLCRQNDRMTYPVL